MLLAWGRGEQAAFDELVALVHAELRKIAGRLMRHERQGVSLQATALVNEAYLRLIELERIRWEDRAHFFAIAARMMRRVLIDAARSRQNLKRGGDLVRVTLADDLLAPSSSERDLIALDDALLAFERVHPRKVQVVELRFFGGLSVEETAHALGVSTDTVKRDFRFAKLWLLREMRGQQPRGR